MELNINADDYVGSINRPMYQAKDLTQLTVEDLWKEVKSEDEWWGDINERVLGMLELILEKSVEEELMEFLQVARYIRTEARKGMAKAEALDALGDQKTALDLARDAEF